MNYYELLFVDHIHLPHLSRSIFFHLVSPGTAWPPARPTPRPRPATAMSEIGADWTCRKHGVDPVNPGDVKHHYIYTIYTYIMSRSMNTCCISFIILHHINGVHDA